MALESVALTAAADPGGARGAEPREDPDGIPGELVTSATSEASGPAFDQFGIAESIHTALAAAGITRAFPIQALTLPIALEQHDVIGQARTGTGKTLAFAIPILQHLISTPRAKAGAPRALVVVPTRELAIQVADDLRTAAARSDVNVVTLYGGRAYEPQIEALATVDVVVGTPGRILDLTRQRQLDLSAIDVLVLDEADRMLDLGFLPDVEAILRLTPAHRQTMLFSATMPSEIVTLARRYLYQPTHIRAEQHDEPAHVPTTDQHVFRAHHLDKIEVLARVLQAEGRGLTIVFCRTRRACDQVTSELTDRGFAAAAVHGDLGQSQRERALRAFRRGKIDVLVATDVAARGLDVEDVTHVVNNECPEDEKAYLHRIGRTGRAGRTGVAVTFVDWQDMARWKLISDTLKLGHPEPLETYSTSEHLFSALGIPADATGSLPSARRGRAGLEAEDLEDIGETGKNRARRHGTASRRPREERGSGHRSGDGTASGRRSGGSRSRSRQRTRGGAPVLTSGAPGQDRSSSQAKVTGAAAGERQSNENKEPRQAGRSDQADGSGLSADARPKARRRSRGRGRGTSASARSADGQPRSTRPASTAEQRDIAGN
ncbi:MAG: DEAD/DEAH box helicase [Nocardiopsaceae bacterium]|jgi:superfamily II DNA/RNA helicase|nr:DEAD/DEAH box helicase [Nocardiopsaceae bacterium]